MYPAASPSCCAPVQRFALANSTRQFKVALARRKDYPQAKRWGSEPLSDVSFVMILAGLLFGAGTALIGFVGLLGAWFHRSLGSPLPLPTLQRASDRRITMWVSLAGFLLWAAITLITMQIYR